MGLTAFAPKSDCVDRFRRKWPLTLLLFSKSDRFFEVIGTREVLRRLSKVVIPFASAMKMCVGHSESGGLIFDIPQPTSPRLVVVGHQFLKSVHSEHADLGLPPLVNGMELELLHFDLVLGFVVDCDVDVFAAFCEQLAARGETGSQQDKR